MKNKVKMFGHLKTRLITIQKKNSTKLGLGGPLFIFFSTPSGKSAGLAGVSSGVGLDDGLLVCTLLLLI